MVNDNDFDTSILVRTNENDFDDFKKICDKQGQKLSDILRELILNYVENTRKTKGVLYKGRKQINKRYPMRLSSQLKNDFNNACEINCQSQVLVLNEMIENFIKENKKEL